MKSFAVIAAAAGIASAASSGMGAPHYVTDVVTAYTTYCPQATMITHGDVTYTVTSATTLTISNCPCTITRPVSSATKPASVVSAAPGTTKAVASSGAPAPVAPVSSTYYAPVPKSSASATTSASGTTYTGAASKVQVAGGLLAALGLVAAAL